MKIIPLLLFSILILQRCNSHDSTTKNESAIERENRLISEYHKQVVISKGDQTFFIPKEEVNWYFNKGHFKDITQAKINDNICFFDTIGNIVYQSLVINVNKSNIYIKCQDLKTASYYETVLEISKIKDLDKNYPYSIKSL